MKNTSNTYEIAEEIRSYMKVHSLCAFIASGSILPRENGTDMPMKNAIPFQSADELLVKIPLSDGSAIEGMGIPYGITVITGGGYSENPPYLTPLKWVYTIIFPVTGVNLFSLTRLHSKPMLRTADLLAI